MFVGSILLVTHFGLLGDFDTPFGLLTSLLSALGVIGAVTLVLAAAPYYVNLKLKDRDASKPCPLFDVSAEEANHVASLDFLMFFGPAVGAFSLWQFGERMWASILASYGIFLNDSQMFFATWIVMMIFTALVAIAITVKGLPKLPPEVPLTGVSMSPVS